MDAGLLPVKRLAEAKSRLDGYLGAEERLELATAMLEDALDLCSRSDFLTWHVVSGDEEVLARALSAGFAAIRDPEPGDLNSSLRTAIEIVSSSASSVTIIPVDTPLATPSELQDLVDTGSVSDVVVVPAERDAGTNGLYLSPPDVIPPRFGERSLSAYAREAEAARLRCAILPLAGLAVDIDTPEDLEHVAATAARETRTVRLLRGWSAGA